MARTKQTSRKTTRKQETIEMVSKQTLFDFFDSSFSAFVVVTNRFFRAPRGARFFSLAASNFKVCSKQNEQEKHSQTSAQKEGK